MQAKKKTAGRLMPSRFKDDIYDDKKYSTNRTDKTRYD